MNPKRRQRCQKRIIERVHLHDTDTFLLTYSHSLSRLDQRWIEVGLWAGMGLGLALCYLSGALPVMVAGLMLFGGLAALRPDLALLFVPLTAPLFLTPIMLPASGRQFALPPHELALLAITAVTLPNILASYIIPEVRQLFRRGAAVWLPHYRYSIILLRIGAIPTAPHTDIRRLGQPIARYAPEALLLVAGVAGIGMAVPEPQAHADALRAFRWFLAEPLLFIVLIRLHARWPTPGAPTTALVQARRLLNVFVIGGAAVALLGLFQFVSYMLHTQNEPATFAAGVGLLGGIQRVTSVYGNPNNMALYLGRVWPLAAALAINEFRTENPEPRTTIFGSWFWVLGSLLCLAGIVLSLSRGAWLGAGAALLVLLLPAVQHRFGGRRWPIALIAAAIVLIVGALIFGLRGGPLGGSADVRLLFWQESIKLLERQPLGVGLDQFFYYHHPAYGRSLIDPILATTQERYARQPHNLLLEIWFNLGPLGVIAFGWLLLRCLRRARAGLRLPDPIIGLLARGVIAALVAALVHGMVDSFYFWPDIAMAFWLLVGVSELLEQHNRASE
jgi:putative inorganic carbon (hco3(-)) transporter